MVNELQELRDRVVSLERRLRVVMLCAIATAVLGGIVSMSGTTRVDAATFDNSFYGDYFFGGQFSGDVRLYEGDGVRFGIVDGQGGELSSHDGAQDLVFRDTLGTERLALGMDSTGACYLTMRDILGRRRFHKRFR